MNPTFDPALDLSISRIIRAPRAAIWKAWTDPRQFEQWWIPEPARCKVAAMEMRPGGAFKTEMSEDGAPFVPHIDGCFLAVENGEKIVFTTALVAGWRPAENPFITAIITLKDHPDGTTYAAHVMHKNGAERTMHDEMGFADGWGTVIEQLAKKVERLS
jgi:uncharacterized protein YndB with AHSA1/START domain